VSAVARRSAIVTLLTDFGTADTYVAQMKGAVLSRASMAQIVDLTHEIAPGDVRGAAFALASAFMRFPRGTIHVAVVDPAVGTSQARLAVRSAIGHFFLAPDNGLLTPALDELRGVEARRLSVGPAAAATFHGRDVFARAAAHLASGGSFAALGARMKTIARLELPAVRRTARGLEGEVVHVDRFGNLVTNLRPWDLRGGNPVFRVGRKKDAVRGLSRTYGDAPAGGLLVLSGSSSHLEISVSSGSAAARLRARRGTRVIVEES